MGEGSTFHLCQFSIPLSCSTDADTALFLLAQDRLFPHRVRVTLKPLSDSFISLRPVGFPMLLGRWLSANNSDPFVEKFPFLSV